MKVKIYIDKKRVSFDYGYNAKNDKNKPTMWIGDITYGEKETTGAVVSWDEKDKVEFEIIDVRK